MRAFVSVCLCVCVSVRLCVCVSVRLPEFPLLPDSRTTYPRMHAICAYQQAERLRLRQKGALLGIYLPVREYLAAFTTRPVTFSAPDEAAAALAAKVGPGGSLQRR